MNYKLAKFFILISLFLSMSACMQQTEKISDNNTVEIKLRKANWESLSKTNKKVELSDFKNAYIGKLSDRFYMIIEPASSTRKFYDAKEKRIANQFSAYSIQSKYRTNLHNKVGKIIVIGYTQGSGSGRSYQRAKLVYVGATGLYEAADIPTYSTENYEEESNGETISIEYSAKGKIEISKNNLIVNSNIDLINDNLSSGKKITKSNCFKTIFTWNPELHKYESPKSYELENKFNGLAVSELIEPSAK